MSQSFLTEIGRKMANGKLLRISSTALVAEYTQTMQSVPSLSMLKLDSF